MCENVAFPFVHISEEAQRETGAAWNVAEAARLFEAGGEHLDRTIDGGGGATSGLQGIPPRTDICGSVGSDRQGGFGAEGCEEAFGGLAVLEGCLVGALGQLAAAPFVEELRDGDEVEGVAGGFF